MKPGTVLNNAGLFFLLQSHFYGCKLKSCIYSTNYQRQRICKYELEALKNKPQVQLK